MKVTLHLAISCDGFIAKKDGNSDWVSPVDGKIFIQRAKEAGCVIVGRKTFAQYLGDLFPLEKVQNIVLTKKKMAHKNVMFVGSPQKALALAKSMKFKNVLLAGGGKTSTAFLKACLINEIFLTVHPLILGKGIKVFNVTTTREKLKLIGSKALKDGLVQLHYRVT